MTSKKTAKIIKNIVIRLVSLIAIVAIISLGAHFYFKQKANSADDTEKEPEKKDTHIEFLLEINDKIKENYWQKIDNQELFELYKLALEKANEEITRPNQTEKPNSKVIITGNETKLESMLNKELKNLDLETKKQLTVNTASLVLANLKPFSRSGLYTQKNVKELSNTIKNVDPKTDLYQELEVEKDAPQEEINKAYEEKKQGLEETIEVLAEKTELTEEEQEQKIEAEQKLVQVDRAHETLSEPKERENYDETGVESTANSNVLTPKIAYLQIKKFSPTTFQEFINELDSLEDESELETLILDLRDNIGGSIDYLPYFLGIFLGNNQHAYDWYHQEDYIPYRTKNGKMKIIDKLKNTVILANEVTQSSGELMIATLKLYNIATFVGTKTKGWGTIEKVYPIEKQIDPENETYSIFLVHSVTLRDNDGQPIEGRGVDPDIDISNETWQAQLTDHFEDPELTETIKELLEK